MEQFKRAQVIMLPTKNIDQGIYLNPVPSINIIHFWDFRISNSYIAQHLYIISDDRIKEGDYALDITTNLIQKVVDYTGYLEDNKNGAKWKKIIATTDTSLTNELYHPNLGTNIKTILPQPSQQFIEKYIEEYNKGLPIKEIMVEYENIMCPNEPKCINCYSKCLIGQKLKINPKDNTITIKKLKESWNREEMFELLKKAYLQGRNDGHCTFRVEELGFDNWIKENL